MSSRRKRKRRIKIIPVIIMLFIIISIICGIFFGIKYIKNDHKLKINKPDIKEEEPKEYKTNLIMVGDALIHGSVYRDANRLANYNGYDFKPQIKYRIN